MFNASTSKFIATHLVFKSPSEHTVNGHHQDLEMQIFHKAESFNDTANIKYAAVSVFFSVEEFEEVDET
jgi:carbonic anhydrase